MSSLIDLSEQDGIVTVRIDRPPANAMSLELLQAGEQVLQQLTGDPPRAVVITGSGDFFSAGMDLRLAPTLSAEQQADVVRRLNRLFAGWYGFPRPVLAAINGHAMAGGLVLALCGDYRLSVPGATLGLSEVRVGLPFPLAALRVVRRELRAEVCRRWVLTGSAVPAPQALSDGVVDEVCAPLELEPRAHELALQLAALPHPGFSRIKRQLRASALDEIDAAIASDGDPLVAQWLGEDTAAASRRQLEGRPS